MSKYERIDEKYIINLNDIVTSYEDMQVKMVDGEFLTFPSEEIERMRCKLLIKAYAILRSYEKEIEKDFAELNPYPILPSEGAFIRAAHRLLYIYHNDIEKIEGFFGKQETDWSKLQTYFNDKFDFTKFINELIKEDKRNGRVHARIAYLIFKSQHRNNSKLRKLKFSDWYKTFCKIVGCTFVKDYKKESKAKCPNKEKYPYEWVNYNDLRNKYSFLEPLES